MVFFDTLARESECEYADNDIHEEPLGRDRRDYRAIIEHPFNRELGQGTLPVEKFKFYIQQDALYLVDFSRALAIVGAKARLPGWILDFLEFAKDGLVVERALHEEYFLVLLVTPEVEQAPGCFTYTNYLVATASHRSFEEAAALLPCFGI